MSAVLLRLHRWSGLLIAVCVLVIGATGAVTTYQSEIDAWLNADLLRIVPPRVAPLPAGVSAQRPAAVSLDEVVRRAEATWPGLRATSVRLPQDSEQSVEVSVAPSGGDDFAGQYVYVDPLRGQVLGSRPFEPDPWSRRGIVAALYEVHYSLAASRAGVWLVSAVACVWLLTSVIGLVLAWPRTRAQWRCLPRVRLRATPAHFCLDLHRLSGLCAAPVLLVVLATGIALNLSPQSTAWLQRFSPLTFEPPLPARTHAPTSSLIGWHAVMDAAVRSQPRSRLYSLYLDAEQQVYVARLREPDALHRRGQTRVFIDARDARVLAVWNPRSGSMGDRLWAWQNPLHSGYAFGEAGRALVFLSGLAALVFVLTGVPLWYARRY